MQNWIVQTAAETALRALSPKFLNAGIPLIPVKGVVLGRWIYSDVADRPLRDLDLLIRRRDMAALRREIYRSGWTLVRDSQELGELEFIVGRMTVEAHAEVARRDLTTFTVEDFLSRSTLDLQTFGFEIRRIDDVDHTLLLVVDVVKDWFVEANRHQPADIERLLRRISTRDLIDRARAGRFTTGLYNAASWLVEDHPCKAFQFLLDELGPPERSLQPYLVRRLRRSARPDRRLGLALACWTNDDWTVRTCGLARILRRGLWRAAGHDPG